MCAKSIELLFFTAICNYPERKRVVRKIPPRKIPLRSQLMLSFLRCPAVTSKSQFKDRSLGHPLVAEKSHELCVWTQKASDLGGFLNGHHQIFHSTLKMHSDQENRREWKEFGITRLGFESELCHLLAMQTWVWLVSFCRAVVESGVSH